VSGLFAGDREHAIALINNGAAEMEMGLAKKQAKRNEGAGNQFTLLFFRRKCVAPK